MNLIFCVEVQLNILLLELTSNSTSHPLKFDLTPHVDLDLGGQKLKIDISNVQVGQHSNSTVTHILLKNKRSINL